MSNTKLNNFEREIRRGLKAEFPTAELFSFPEFNCVVGIERTGETMGRFAVSICGDTEHKFRRKVGEYNVLNRFCEGYTQPVYIGEGYTQPVYIGETSLSGLAYEIASVVGRYS